MSNNDHNPAPAAPEGEVPIHETDVLLSRAVDGEATRVDWVLLESRASQDPSLWHRYAMLSRDQALLAREVRAAEVRALSTELPPRAAIGVSWNTSALRSWGGWAAAAVLTLAFALRVNPAADTHLPTPNTQSAGLLASADDLLKGYLAKGKQEGVVISEVPTMLLLNKSPTQDGKGFEVTYLRQIVERKVVNDLIGFGTDDAGNVVPVPVQRPTENKWSDRAAGTRGAL